MSEVSHAQQITGRVLDHSGNEPLIGANVYIPSTGMGAATDTSGFFRIGPLDTGSYQLVVSMLGFQRQVKKVKLNRGDSLVLRFQLKLKSEALQGIEIMGRRQQSYKVDYSFTATRLATAVEDIPQSVSIISKELMDDQQTYTLGEVAKNISGFNQFSYYNDFTVRGFRGGARLINGLRAEQNPFSMPITPHLERIEVIKGPASALFANANPGGTINMVTKKPLRRKHAEMQFTGGSFDTYRGTFDAGGPLDSSKHWLYRVNAGYENSGSFRDFQGNTTYLLAPSLSFLPSDRTQINLDLVYSRDESKLDRGQPIFDEDQDLSTTPISFTLSQPTDFNILNNWQANTSFSQEIGDQFSFNLSYMYFQAFNNLEEHRTSNRFRDENSIIMSFIKRKRRITSHSLTSYFNGNFTQGKLKHRALVGFDYINSSADRFQWTSGLIRSDSKGVYPADFNLNNPDYRQDNPVESYTRGTQREWGEPTRYNTWGVYLQDQVTYGRWKGLISLRREQYQDVIPVRNATRTSDQIAWLPRLGLTFETPWQTNLYLSYATGFQPVDAQNNVPEFGGPFDPERSRSFEVGAKGNFFQERLMPTVAVYQITKSNILVNANDPQNPQFLAQRGEQQSYGLEVEMKGRVNEHLSMVLNYAWNRAEITQSNKPEKIGQRAENAPKHMGGLWVKYAFLQKPWNGLSAGGGLNFMSGRRTFDERLQLPGYLVADMALHYTYHQFKIGLNINNVLDQKHWIGGYNFSRVFPGAPRHFLASLTYIF